MRHRLLFISFFLCVFTGTIAAQSVVWKPTVQLDWDNFNGVPDPANTATSQTWYNLSYNYSWDDGGKIVVTVECELDDAKTWKRQGRLLTADLLRHEQFHFNIGELYTRRMREAFTAYAAKHRYNAHSAEQLAQIHARLVREATEMNNRYDGETNHSANAAKQREWEQRITQWLDEMRDYEMGG